MKFLSLFFWTAILVSPSFLFAQRQADWSVNLTGNTQQIILQNLTGIPIVQTDKAYIGIDPANQKVAWTIERKTSKLVNSLLNTESFDFYNMVGTPFVLISNSVIDTRTGAAIIDKKKNEFRRVEDYEIIPALKSALVRVTANNGMVRLYLIGMSDGKIKWETDVVKPLKIMGLDEVPEEEHVDVPLFTTLVSPDKYLIYRFQRSIAVISPEGKLMWVEKENPAEVMLSPDGEKILLVSTLLTGVANSPVEVRYTTKYRGAKLSAVDIKTGKPSWKEEIKVSQNIRWADPQSNFLTLVWGNGCNVYNYATGQAHWANDFKGKGIIEVTPNDKGYLVTYEYGYKTMQLNEKGKELWEAPQVLETEETDLSEESNVDVYQYANGKVLIDFRRIRFRPAKDSSLKKWSMNLDPTSGIVYDDSLKNIILLHDKRLFIVNPDNNPEVVKSYPVDFENIPAFHTVEFREKGYFLSSSKEFVSINLEAEKVSHKYYPSPTDPGSFFLNMINAELALTGNMLSANGHMDMSIGAQKSQRASYGLLPPGAGKTEIKRARRQFLAADGIDFVATFVPPARFEAFRQSQDNAWYFTQKNDDKMLVKVNKDTGQEVDQILIDNSRPIYQIDTPENRIYYGNGQVLKVFNM